MIIEMSYFCDNEENEYSIGSIGYNYNFRVNTSIGDEDLIEQDYEDVIRDNSRKARKNSSISYKLGPDVTLFLSHPLIEPADSRRDIELTTGVITHKSKYKMRYRNYLISEVLPILQYEINILQKEKYEQDQIEAIIHKAFLDTVFHSLNQYTKEDKEQFMALYGFFESSNTILKRNPRISNDLKYQIEQELLTAKSFLDFHNMKY